MSLPIKPPYAPMEATLMSEIPSGNWQYEPKWDGFRCLAFRDGGSVYLQSKAGQPLHRYFPELVEALGRVKAKRFVLDGEIVVPVEGTLSFDQLLQRIHPAESRIRKLSTETPAQLLVFDLLVDEKNRSLVGKPLRDRRTALEAFAEEHLAASEALRLSPATEDRRQVQRWFESSGGSLDGIIAKDLALPYRSGTRDGMRKVKKLRTAECVVAGFRYGSKATKTLGSLLLGLYDDDGLLHHVGFCSALTAKHRKDLTPKIEALKLPASKGGGFSGRSPGGPSRWSTERSGQWESLKPKLVVEVQYDHFTNGRFRHGTRFLRWRPEKAPEKCTMDQMETAGTALNLALTADSLREKSRTKR